jgi:hypothetical protein
VKAAVTKPDDPGQKLDQVLQNDFQFSVGRAGLIKLYCFVPTIVFLLLHFYVVCTGSSFFPVA